MSFADRSGEPVWYLVGPLLTPPMSMNEYAPATVILIFYYRTKYLEMPARIKCEKSISAKTLLISNNNTSSHDFSAQLLIS